MVPYYGDFPDNHANIRIPFNTFDSNDPSASVTITNLADTDIHVHKDGSLTQTTTDATVIINFDGITGNHVVKIDASSDAFYVAGAEYMVRIEGTTVDAGTINGWIGAFSIERAGGTLALIKAGNLSANVVQISGDGTAADNAELFFDGTGYAGTNNVIPTVTTLTNKTGFSLVSTGMDAVLVSSTYVAALIAGVWDRVLTGATHNISTSAGRRLRGIQEFQGYEGGAIWIDTVNGTAGTTDFENGTVENPVDSIADANTLASSLGLADFHMASASSITLAASQENQILFGENWTLALGGQSIAGTHIAGAEVSGTGTGACSMDHCHLGAVSIGGGEFEACGFQDTFTMTGAVDYDFINCYHANTGAPSTLDFGSAVGASGVHMHGWMGNVLIRNMDTGDVLHFSSSEGTMELDSSNTAGTANLTGVFGFTDGSSGMTINNNGQAITDIAAVKAETALIVADTNELQTDDIPSLLPAALVGGRMDSNMGAVSGDATAADRFEAVMDATFIGQVNGGTPSTTVFIVDGTGLVDATDDHYVGRLITFTTGALAGQQTDVTASNGSTKALTVTALTEAPANDDFFNMT